MLKGSLDDFTLSDIFRLLSFTKKTGKLEVGRSAGDGKVYFCDGEVYFAQSSIKSEPLGQKLVRAGALTESALMRALDLNARTGERVGEILLREGAITEEQLIAGVRGQIEDAVFDLLRWEVGEFEFESHERFTVEIPISVSVENLVMEASRRLDELRTMQMKIPSTEVVLAVAPAPPEGAREINITPDEWRLLVLVDGNRTVGEICQMSNLDEFTGFRTLYGLISSGLVDVASLGPTAQPSPIARPPMEDAEGRLVAGGPADTIEGPSGDYGHDAPQEEFGFVPTTPASPPDVVEVEKPADHELNFAPTNFDADHTESHAWADDGVDESQLAEVGSVIRDEAVTEGADSFLSDILNGEPTLERGEIDGGSHEETPAVDQEEEPTLEGDVGGDSHEETLAVDREEPPAADPATAKVDRAAVVRELAGLFNDDEMRPRRTRSSKSGDDDSGDESPSPVAKRRVEDDDEINKGLIGRFIDGVKGM
jgi:hypothetical protein